MRSLIRTFSWLQRSVWASTSRPRRSSATVSGTCWPRGARGRSGSVSYPADMAKKSWNAPALIASTTTPPIFCSISTRSAVAVERLLVFERHGACGRDENVPHLSDIGLGGRGEYAHEHRPRLIAQGGHNGLIRHVHFLGALEPESVVGLERLDRLAISGQKSPDIVGVGRGVAYIGRIEQERRVG